jgi:hypothetical protein
MTRHAKCRLEWSSGTGSNMSFHLGPEVSFRLGPEVIGFLWDRKYLSVWDRTEVICLPDSLMGYGTGSNMVPDSLRGPEVIGGPDSLMGPEVICLPDMGPEVICLPGYGTGNE